MRRSVDSLLALDNNVITVTEQTVAYTPRAAVVVRWLCTWHSNLEVVGLILATNELTDVSLRRIIPHAVSRRPRMLIIALTQRSLAVPRPTQTTEKPRPSLGQRVGLKVQTSRFEKKSKSPYQCTINPQETPHLSENTDIALKTPHDPAGCSTGALGKTVSNNTRRLIAR
ncbi:hypothetical protein EVAR_37474_1 [Eumeta japonica]|uniref:Uncharacterized protein n=1 Tax=Eumeta variegata TaxID=151549 RepID=A0A4C1XDN2_EUMVA|nr:hypothetical protein EVAR_37474_1 [Eumeta japonica]